MGSNMCNSKRLDYGRDLYASEQKADIKWNDAIELAAAAGDVGSDLKGDFALRVEALPEGQSTVSSLGKKQTNSLSLTRHTSHPLHRPNLIDLLHLADQELQPTLHYIHRFLSRIAQHHVHLTLCAHVRCELH